MERYRPYFSFSGRINRQPYWLTALALVPAYLVAFLLAVFMPVLGPLAAGILVIGAIWVSAANLVRRLHDRGKGAWWLVPMYLPVFVLSLLALAAEGAGEADAAAGLNALTLPFSIWVFVELGCLRGTPGPNRFGLDPLNPLDPLDPLDPSQAEVFD